VLRDVCKRVHHNFLNIISYIKIVKKVDQNPHLHFEPNLLEFMYDQTIHKRSQFLFNLQIPHTRLPPAQKLSPDSDHLQWQLIENGSYIFSILWDALHNQSNLLHHLDVLDWELWFLLHIGNNIDLTEKRVYMYMLIELSCIWYHIKNNM